MTIFEQLHHCHPKLLLKYNLLLYIKASYSVGLYVGMEEVGSGVGDEGTAVFVGDNVDVGDAFGDDVNESNWVLDGSTALTVQG